MGKSNHNFNESSSWFSLLEVENVLSEEVISGVYMVGLKLSDYLEPQVIYTGSSKNLKYRLKQHTILNSIPDLLGELYKCIPIEFFFVKYIRIEGKENYREMENEIIRSTWGNLNTLKRDNESIYVAYDRAVSSLKEIIRTAEQLNTVTNKL